MCVLLAEQRHLSQESVLVPEGAAVAAAQLGRWRVVFQVVSLDDPIVLDIDESSGSARELNRRRGRDAAAQDDGAEA